MAGHCRGFLAIAVLIIQWPQLITAWPVRLPRLGGLLGQPVPPTEGICALIVTGKGYKCQEFDVETTDGFILSVQRIPEGWGGRRGHGQPVILQHGVLVDGMTWMLNSPEQNLPMILADKGFDVWIVNTRGTRYSRRHKSLVSSDPAFWDWSFDELALHDFPTVFDFVYARTGNQKIHYIGHSLGTLIALASLSEGKLVDRMRSVALLSPVAYLSHMTTALGVVAAKSPLSEIFTMLQIAEFNPTGEAVHKFLKTLCSHPGVDCYDLLTALTGKNCCLNVTTVDLFLKNEPQSTSTKNIIHLAQIVRERRFAKFDYGRSEYNVMHYGEEVPPAYDLAKIPQDMPIFISYGGRDALSDTLDVQTLLGSLKQHDVAKLFVQFVEEYAHADFIMGVNAKDIVYNQVQSFFNKVH